MCIGNPFYFCFFFFLIFFVYRVVAVEEAAAAAAAAAAEKIAADGAAVAAAAVESGPAVARQKGLGNDVADAADRNARRCSHFHGDHGCCDCLLQQCHTPHREENH